MKFLSTPGGARRPSGWPSTAVERPSTAVEMQRKYIFIGFSMSRLHMYIFYVGFSMSGLPLAGLEKAASQPRRSSSVASFEARLDCASMSCA